MDHVEQCLRAGHGRFIAAPASVCAVAAAVLDAAGVATSILGSAPRRDGHRVMLLGRSYIVAAAFAFERR